MQKSLMSTVVSIDPGREAGSPRNDAGDAADGPRQNNVANERNEQSFKKRKDGQATHMLMNLSEQVRLVQEDVANLLNESNYNIQQDVRVLCSLMRSSMEQSRLQHEEQTKAFGVLHKAMGKMTVSGEEPLPGEFLQLARVPAVQESSQSAPPGPTDSLLSAMSERGPLDPLASTSSLFSNLADSAEPQTWIGTGIEDDAGAIMPEDIGLTTATGTLFDAVAVADFRQVRSLLAARADPNERRDDFSCASMEKHFSPCSLFALAVMRGDIGIVNELIKYKAQLEGDYGFIAGTAKMRWSGSAVFGVVPHGHFDLLKLLVSKQVDIHEKSSNNANLVWQCCYFGQTEMLKYLITKGVSITQTAQSQDQKGIHLTPLHTAAHKGNHNCIEVLLSRRVDVNTFNEANLSPLDDAITHCKPACVQMLIAGGAHLFEEKVLAEPVHHDSFGRGPRSSVTATHMKAIHAIKNSEWKKPNSEKMRTLDLLFSYGNPVIVAAAAAGLRNQDEQMKGLNTHELCRFLTTSGEAPKHILQAVFSKRDVKYVRDNSTRGDPSARVHIVTAHIRKPQQLPNGDNYEYINVAAMHMTYDEIQKKFKRREKLDPVALALLDELAPQEGDKYSLMSSVEVFESLVPHIHNDLQVVKAISNLDNHLYELKPVQAIIGYCWMHTRNHALLELFFHVCLMLSFFIIGVLLRPPNPEEQGWYIRCLAGMAGMIWSCELMFEVAQFWSFYRQGWLSDYLKNWGTYVDWARLGADMCTLGFLWHKGLDAISYGTFLVVFALCSFYKWIMILYALTPFRLFGLSIIPILHTMLDVGPFFTVLAFFMLGLMHGYMSLSVPDISLFESGLLVYRLGLLGEIDPAELNAGNQQYYYVTRIFFIVVCFFVTVTLMNTFIAALGNSFSLASNRMEILFQSHRADRVLNHMAVSHGLRKVFRSKSSKTSDKDSFWFCCASNSLDA